MLQNEILNLLLQDIPESIIFTIFCFVFLNLRLRWRQILVIALLVSITDVVEVLPWPFGIRAIVLMLGLSVFIRIFTRKELSKVFLAVFALFLLDAVGDFSLGMSILLTISHMSYIYVYNTPYLRALFSYPTLISILVVTYFMYRYKKKNMIEFE